MAAYLILTVLAAWSVFVFGSVLVFYRSRGALAIRSRGVSLTVVLALTQWCMVGWLLFRGMGMVNMCMVDLWMAGLLFPLWSAALLARFLRIMFLHRSNQYRLNTSFVPDLSKSEGLDIHQSVSNTSRSYPRMDLWLHTHRGWFGSVGLTLSLFGFLFFNVVITLLLQILSSYGPGCPGSWVRYPALCITAAILLLEWPVFILLFRDLQETFGIRLEWVIHLILSPCTLLLQVFLTLTDREEDPILYIALHLIAIALVCVMHLLTVGFPLWWARRESNPFAMQRLCQTTEARRSFLIQGARSSLKDPSKLSLQSVLDNPLLFIDFKLFSAHNFCVENVMFHERFKSLSNWNPDSATRPPSLTKICPSDRSSTDAQPPVFADTYSSTDRLQPINHPAWRTTTLSITTQPNLDFSYLGPAANPSIVSPTANAFPESPLQDEILSIYRNFIAHDAPFQINLSSAVKRAISDSIQKSILTPDIFTQAYNEIYFLLMQDVFPRYLRSIENSSDP